MTALPEPFTPVDCDLRGLEFMPLDTVRLLDSDLFAIATGEEFKAALALWCKSWLQVPAASLPDDPRVLAHLSGTGPRWNKVKEVALRNWVKCSDGRLYHPVVAEKAMEALPRRKAYQETKSTETSRKEREREDRKRMFADLRGIDVEVPWNIKTSELRKLHGENQSRFPSVTGHENSVTGGVTSPGHVTAKTGTGTGTGTGTLPPTPRPDTPVQTDVGKVMLAAGMSNMPPDTGLVREWLDLPDMELERDILPVVRRVAEQEMGRSGRAPFKFKLFDAAVRQQQAEDAAEIARLRRGRERIAEQDERQRAEDAA